MSSVVILNFPMRHAHDRYVCLILFKFGYDVAICNPLFGNENQENRSITSGFIKNRTYDFFFFAFFTQNRLKNQICPTKASEVSFSNN